MSGPGPTHEDRLGPESERPREEPTHRTGPSEPGRQASAEAPTRSKVLLPPTPQVRRVGKTSVLLVLVAVLALMTVLSFRYSRQAAPRSAPDEAPVGFSELPLAPSEIERIEPRAAPSAPLEPPEPNRLLERLRAAQRARELRAERARTEAPGPVVPTFRPRPKRPERPERTIAAPLEVRRPGGARSAPATPGRASAPDPAADLLALGLGGLTLPTAAPDQQPSPPPAPDPRVLAVPETDGAFGQVSPPPLGSVLWEGTVLPAVLTQAVASDLAGPVQAVLARDVYDSQTFSRLLLPRGTLALGRQTRQPLFGESRLLILWHRLLLPDGRSIALDASPATGSDGALGLPGKVSHHWGKRFAAVGLLSLAGAGVQLSQPQRAASGLEAPDAGQLAAGELGLQIGRLSQEILRQAVNVPPTVSLAPGSRLGILVNRDLVFADERSGRPSR